MGRVELLIEKNVFNDLQLRSFFVLVDLGSIWITSAYNRKGSWVLTESFLQIALKK